MKKPIAIWTAVLLVVGLSVAAYFFWPSPRDRTPTVRIGYLNIVASLPLFIADEKGLLRQQGVQYELIPFATSNQLVDAIVAHNIDCFVESSAVPVLAAELRAPGYMKIFAASEITESAPFDAIIVSNSSPIRDLSGLDGKNVGVFPGSTATKLLQAFLREKGIASDTVTFSPIPPQNQLAALSEGAIDALHAYEPTTAIALAKGNFRRIYGSVYAEMLSPNPQGVAVVSTTFVQEQPELAKRTIDALEAAMDFMRQHDADSRAVMQQRFRLSDNAETAVVFLYMSGHAEIDRNALQRYADMLHALGELDGRVDTAQMIYASH